MEHLDAILKISGNELSEVEKNGRFRSREEIDSVYKLIDIVKDIYCIQDMEDGDMSYDYSMRYDDNSYARGRGRKRDSMGRYSRTSYRYSRDGREEYVEHLREMMEDAPDEQTRQSLQRMIEQMH